MLARIDRALVACHQHATDALQRPPRWLARQCAFFAAVCSGVRAAAAPLDALGLTLAVLMLAVCAALALCTLSGAVLARFDCRGSRLCWAASVLLNAAVALGSRSPGAYAALSLLLSLSLLSLSLLSFHCFAACKAPPPPRRRTRRTPRRALGGAA